MKSEHPTYLGEILNAEKNTAVYVTEERTIQFLQNENENKMTWRPGATYGIFLDTVWRHHSQQRVKLYVSKESSVPSPLKFLGVVRQTNMRFGGLARKSDQ